MKEKLPDRCFADLQSGVEKLALDLHQDQMQQLLDYVCLLIKWNKAYNLTAIREPLAMVHRHLLDALSVLPYLDLDNYLDMGTGAGVPGVMIAICKPEINLTLLDSNGKKTRFLQMVKAELQLTNIDVQQSRVESYSPKVLFDRIVCRAFTALDKMIELSGHLVAEQGKILAMKGAYPEPDQRSLPEGWIVEQAINLRVPFVEEQRHLVILSRH